MKATATLHIEILVSCPKCNNTIDLLDEHNEDNAIKAKEVE
jgi:hypothetical protein